MPETYAEYFWFGFEALALVGIFAWVLRDDAREFRRLSGPPTEDTTKTRRAE